MKHNVQKPFILLVLAVSIILTLALIGIANAEGPVITAKSKDKGWSAHKRRTLHLPSALGSEPAGLLLPVPQLYGARHQGLA